MNVYDFDGTIYDGDSSIDFWKYCFIKQHFSLCYFVSLICAFILYSLKVYSKEQYKSVFFSFVKQVDNIERCVSDFWNIYRQKVKKFYLAQHKVGDVVISASPDFLLHPLCDEWGVIVIASNVDPQTGKWSGKNCYGKEKVRRFQAMFPEKDIAQFYSDNISDTPMALFSKSAYMVKDDLIIPWNKQST